MAIVLTARNLSDARGLVDERAAIRRADSGGEKALVEPPATPPPDDSLSKILKLVPGEAAVAYTAGLAIGTEVGDTTAKYLPPAVFVLCAIMIPFLIARDGARQSPPVKPEPVQYLIQLLAFAAWAFSIGNPLAPAGVTVPKWIPALLAIFLPIIGGLVLDRQGRLPADPLASAPPSK